MAANKDLTQLTETTSPQPDDLFYIVTNTDTTPVDQKITFGNLATASSGITTLDFGSIVEYSYTNIHTAITLTASPQTITTGFSSPDTPRSILTVVQAGGGTYEGTTITIHGTDFNNAAISEVVTPNAQATSYAQTSKAFKTVTSVVLPAKITNGDTISFGAGGNIGLNAIYAPTYCFAIEGGSVLNGFNMNSDLVNISGNVFSTTYNVAGNAPDVSATLKLFLFNT
jgi:hypothetical protein